MKNENIIFYGSLGIALVVFTYLIVKKQSEKQKGGDGATTPPPPTTGGGNWSSGGGATTPQTPALNLDKELYKGVNAPNEVTELQKLINRYNSEHSVGLSSLTVDGIFGSATENAVLALSNGTTNKVTLREAYTAAGYTPPAATTTGGGTTAAEQQAAAQAAQEYVYSSIGFGWLNWLF